MWSKHIPQKNLMETPISSPVASLCPGCNVVLFQISLSTLVTLHNNYLRSKEVKNILERYSLMREMIKVSVIKWKYVHSIGIHVPLYIARVHWRQIPLEVYFPQILWNSYFRCIFRRGIWVVKSSLWKNDKFISRWWCIFKTRKSWLNLCRRLSELSQPGGP